MTIKWTEYTISKVEELPKEVEELSFCYYQTINDKLPEFQKLEDGHYRVNEVDQYFEISNANGYKEIIFPLSKKSVVQDYLDKISEREQQEVLGEILAEITDFNNDLHNELVWENDVAKLKPYYNRELEIRRYVYIEKYDGNKLLQFYEYYLYVGERYEVDIYFTDGEGKSYSAYDGVEGYGTHFTLKEAVKAYMDSGNFYYDTDEEYYEASCSNCGDGGCFHCEPQRFL